MKGFKEIFFDFLNFAFLLLLIAFFIIYMIFGDRFIALTKIMQAMAPVAFFGILMLVKIKQEREKVKKFKNDQNQDEILVFFSPIDRIKDMIVIFLSAIIVFGIAIFNFNADLSDLIQSLVVPVVMIPANMLLFRARNTPVSEYYATRLDQSIDEIILYVLPAVISIVALFTVSIDIVDLVQAITPFAIFVIWRKRLFRHVK